MRISVEEVYSTYARNIYNAAFSITANAEDAKDVLSDTLIRYLHTETEFDSAEHLKAWLLRTAINRAKDIRRAFWNRNRVSFEEYMEEIPAADSSKELLDALMRLPVRYRSVLHLYYYEGYSQKEISALLRIPEGTVNSRMSAARKKLRKILEEDWDDE